MRIAAMKADVTKVVGSAKEAIERELTYRVQQARRQLDEMQADALRALDAAEEASKLNVAGLLDGKMVYKATVKVSGTGAGGSYCFEARDSFVKLQRVPEGDYEALVILTPTKKVGEVKHAKA